MNGQHLRSFPHDELIKAFENRWKNTGILQESESGFAQVKLQAILFSCTPRVSYFEVRIKGVLYIPETNSGMFCLYKIKAIKKKDSFLLFWKHNKNFAFIY
jgi:hypothetical protein